MAAGSRRVSARAKVALGTVVMLVAAIGVLAAVAVHEYRHEADDEAAAAEQYLDLDTATSSVLTTDSGAFFDDGVGSGIDSAFVTYATTDPQATLAELANRLAADGWDRASGSGDLWHGGLGTQFWASTWVDDGDVRLRIGSIEG